MENNILNGGEPGAARFGNFISYYNFHPPEERLKLLPWNDIVASCSQNVEEGRNKEFISILDVGCNTGELTEQVAKRLESLTGKPCYTLAVDLDPVLIQRAKEASNSTSHVDYQVSDVSTSEFLAKAMAFLSKIGVPTFDVSFLFSITMWIHLNGGDEALERSLLQVSKLSSTVVVEPQPWKCYRGAVRRMKRANAEPFSHFDKLTMRLNIEDDIGRILTDISKMKKVGESDRTSWGRKIYLFLKTVT